MRPTLLDHDTIQMYLENGSWSTETMVERYQWYAQVSPAQLACRDQQDSYTWDSLNKFSNRLAKQLINVKLERDCRAVVQVPSSCREMLIRIALKKAGVIGVFVPLQWRLKELSFVIEQVRPSLFIADLSVRKGDDVDWLDDLVIAATSIAQLIDLGDMKRMGWLAWDELKVESAALEDVGPVSDRGFKFDEVSLISASSGTTGLAKLCEWPEAAQLCAGRGIAENLMITEDDKIGVFAPLSGAAGILALMISGTIPCAYMFPKSYKAGELLELVDEEGVTVITTVPVILARLAAEDLSRYTLRTLKTLRVGTAATNIHAAKSFEDRTQCRVVVASGSMECPGFGHAHVDEFQALRLNGSVGLPLPTCSIRIEDDLGGEVPSGKSGELKVRAAFASSGYWNDPITTKKSWDRHWYSTGDIGLIDEDGRLRLLGRIKETINRSGHKILPGEIEQELTSYPEIFDCAVIAGPDAEYGEVPWAFIQPSHGTDIKEETLSKRLKASGLAHYKIPVRFIEVRELPRISGNKIDKNKLLSIAR